MDNASDDGSEGSRFYSWLARCGILTVVHKLHVSFDEKSICTNFRPIQRNVDQIQSASLKKFIFAKYFSKNMDYFEKTFTEKLSLSFFLKNSLNDGFSLKYLETICEQV